MNIHVMICEDEELAREELMFLLECEPDVSVCPSAETGEQLIELYVEHEPDVIFLDVHMPGMHGVEAAKKITELAYLAPPLFIFTTAYESYAVTAFEIQAVDYILKPYDADRFQTAMQRARNKLKQLDSKKETAAYQHHTAPGKLLIDDEERMMVVAPESIYYAAPFKRMLEIHTEGQVITSKMTLQELEHKLKGHSFFRTHRSYLVNLNHIQEITPWFNGTSNVTLKDKNQTTIPVSRAARKQLFNIFDN
ncbi:LytR/AlgR family response regulator transcription factor [Virgibacillus natechei]|uniref:LytR/AlgR family response regulator transcription factor n=1 Tax=Virgibacillus sp. CBA3643 TaxID=2942278 RepID=UPI0035A3C193